MKVAARALVGLVGASDVGGGIALLLQPVWFFQQIGHFAPYNQHYEGDAGAFILAIGIGLLVAAARPAAGRGLLAVGVIASLLHLANHVYASIMDGTAWAGTVPVALQLGLLGLGAAFMYSGTRRNRHSLVY